MKKLYGFLTIFLVIISGLLKAQEVAAVLTDDDIEHFIKTFKPMTAELEEKGHTMEEENEPDPMAGFANIKVAMQEMMVEAEVIAILKKYDWDENFLDTYIAVSMGYFYNKMNMELNKMEEEEKAMAKPMMDMFMTQMKMMVNDKDIEMLQSHMSALDAVFED